MKKIYFLVLVLFLCVNASAQGWKAKTAKFPGYGRVAAVSFTIGNFAYVGLGNNSDDDNRVYYKDFWKYDPALDQWSQIADFPGDGRTGGVAFSVNGKGYVGLGYNGIKIQYFADFYEYDPLNNSWKKVTDFPAGATSVPTAFVIENIAYVGSGNVTGKGRSGDFWKYESTSDKWTKITSLPAGQERGSALSFAIDGYGYVVSGMIGAPGAGVSYPSNLLKYSPGTDSWTEEISSNNLLRYHGYANQVVYVSKNKGYICFYTTSAYANRDIVEYNPVGKTVTQIVNPLGWDSFTRVNGGIAFTVNDVPYYTLGEPSFGDLNTTVWYDSSVNPSTGISVPNVITASVYPNPATDYISINFEEENVTFQLIDGGGRVIKQQPVKPNEVINISSLSRGTYIVKIQSGKGSYSSKLIKK